MFEDISNFRFFTHQYQECTCNSWDINQINVDHFDVTCSTLSSPPLLFLIVRMGYLQCYLPRIRHSISNEIFMKYFLPHQIIRDFPYGYWNRTWLIQISVIRYVLTDICRVHIRLIFSFLMSSFWIMNDAHFMCFANSFSIWFCSTRTPNSRGIGER